MPDYKIGQTITAEEFNKLPNVGETISEEQFSKLEEPTQPKEDNLVKIGKILSTVFGGKQIGEAIGSQIAKGGLGQTIQKAVLGRDLPAEQEKLVSPGPTKTQIGADIAQIGLLLGTLGAGAPATTGGRLLTNAALGASFGATGALKEGKSLKETAEQTVVGGVVGAVAPEIIGYAGKKLSQAIDSGSKMLVNSALNRTGKALEKDIRLGDKELPDFAAKYLKEGKFFATADSARKTIAQNILPETGKKITAIADSSVGNTRIDISDVKGTLNRSAKVLKEIFGDEDTVVKALESGAKKTALTWKNALALKRAVNNKILPPGAFLDARISATNDNLQKAIGKIADRLVEKAKGTDFEQLNATYSLFKSTYDQLVKKATRPSLSFTEKLIALGGGAAAPFTGGASLAPTLKAIVAKKAAESVPVGLGTAFGLQSINKTAQKILAAQPTKKIAKVGLLKMLSKQ